MSAPDFLEKANLLAESRQDVTRLPVDKHFTTAIINRAMERLIRQCPGQYLWGYNRYKKPRTADPG